MTLNILEVEKKLSKTIRRNSICAGFDVAEKFTGICILKTDDINIYVDHLQLIETDSKQDHFHRADHYCAALDKFKQDLIKYKDYKIMVIEACYFGCNPKTLIHLAHFGIITYITLRKKFDIYYYLGATTTRSIIGFNQKRQESNGTLKAKLYTRDTKDKTGKLKHRKGEKKKIACKALVHDYLKTDFNIVIEQEDEADAFVLALAGLLK